jgi:aryl-alcohol dehydrogenase-like predicted oxidoreductase
MHYTTLGPFNHISRLTLGGGGLGQIWGETNSQQAHATLHAAIDAGITLIDTAPSYLHCEREVSEAFSGKLPAGVRITTKCLLGAVPRGSAASTLEASIDASLKAMRIEHADIFFLHSNICEDDYVFVHGNEFRTRFATPWSQYVEEVIPAFEALKAKGKIGAWGITGVGVPSTILKALSHTTKPNVVQLIANLMDSAGALRRYAEPERPRELIAAAKENGIGVMGIRAVQAGALTAGIDRPLKPSHPEVKDFVRAAPFRALCNELKVDPALMAHRYALDMPGVDTVVLGVKNRAELDQCLEAEALGPLTQDLRAQVDGLGLTTHG